MDNVIKAIIGVTVVVFLAFLAMSAGTPQRGKAEPNGPVIKRLSTFRGEHIPSFAEFRVQQIEYDDLGTMHLAGSDPYEMLVNTSYVTAVYRYEDVKKTDYSTLMFLSYQQDPILIRQPYKDVVSSIRRSQEAMVK